MRRKLFGVRNSRTHVIAGNKKLKVPNIYMSTDRAGVVNWTDGKKDSSGQISVRSYHRWRGREHVEAAGSHTPRDIKRNYGLNIGSRTSNKRSRTGRSGG